MLTTATSSRPATPRSYFSTARVIVLRPDYDPAMCIVLRIGRSSPAGDRAATEEGQRSRVSATFGNKSNGTRNRSFQNEAVGDIFWPSEMPKRNFWLSSLYDVL